MIFWKKALMALSLLLLMISVTGMADKPAAASDTPITMKLDGMLLTSEVAPYIKSNTTLVPLRVISDGIGASVQWNGTEKKVTISQSGTTIVLTLGSRTAIVGGSTATLDVALQSVSGRTMVPLRFVSEELGLNVNWNQTTRVITLTSPGWTSGSSNSSGSSGTSDELAASNSLRGAWIASVSNLDWPSSASRGNESKQKQEFTAQLDKLQAEGINAVFVQVRPSADALYPSSLVPWSQVLTGTPGKDPGYDPLAFMIEEAHKRGMEFHAWFNPFRVTTSGTDTSKLAAASVAREHPAWIVKESGKLFLNPGIPDARQHIIDVIMEVVNNYDIDGVHLDDYFYPSDETTSNPFDDSAAFKAYNTGGFKTKADWRRSNINTFVHDLGSAVHSAKPQLAFGISPSGIWRNQSTDPTGSATSGRSAYDTEYADARTWILGRYIDYIAPQVYWSFDTAAAPYDKVVSWWANEVNGTGVNLYIGMAPYKISSPEKGWQSAQELIDQLKYNEQFSQIQGSIFYRSSSLLASPLGLTDLLKAYYGVN
ncbi:family 10 glycosylhydrolase [Paenibacillus pinistramenti]|uniref:family 10 glycosylhydrolase n=1 Tax=Paenibacillus pinistramenti TaxID=1768003 RepID=UPI001107CE75|nr:family 10 glycosylhydrolase [Paenibacillus pinistramenti]